MATETDAARRSRVHLQLADMYRTGQPMSQALFDLLVLDEVGPYIMDEGLCEYLASNPDLRLTLFLHDVFSRHGFPKSAAIMKRYDDLFPADARSMTGEEFLQCLEEVGGRHWNAIEEMSNELGNLRENYDRAADALWEAHKHEVPKPREPGKLIRRAIHPFTGEEIEIRVEAEPDDE